jgi:Arc/MetJ family transcription regulator
MRQLLRIRDVRHIWSRRIGFLIARVAKARCMAPMFRRAVYLKTRGVIMSLTTLDLDDDALAQTMALAGVRTKKDAVNTALREYAERHRRIAALERYADLAADWDYESWAQQHAVEKGSKGDAA